MAGALGPGGDPAVATPGGSDPAVATLGATARMAAFLEQLRVNGFATGPGEARDALTLLAGLPPDRATHRAALKVLLCSDRQGWGRFDDLFDAFWSGRGVRSVIGRPPADATPGARGRDATTQRRPPLWDRHLAAAGAGQTLSQTPHSPADDDPSEASDHTPGGPTGRLVAARSRGRNGTDLRHLADPDLQADALRIATQLARALRDRLSRRHRAAPRGRRPDLRRSLRAALATGGDLHRLTWRHRPTRPVELVVFLDVSGSMEAYARVFLMFLRGLLCQPLRVEAFLIHTRLLRVSDTLSDRDGLRALARLAMMVEGFGGGTRLAAGLDQFNRLHARHTLSARSVVVILSDGYDSDPPEALAEQLRRIKLRARRLVWLNPLLGWRDYRPVARGMAAALPHIDHFAACHSLEALAALEPVFARL